MHDAAHPDTKKKEKSSRETGSGSKHYLPVEQRWRRVGHQTHEFFLSLARLIENTEGQLNSSGFCDTLEFLVRRLDEYERTLSTLLARFC